MYKLITALLKSIDVTYVPAGSFDGELFSDEQIKKHYCDFSQLSKDMTVIVVGADQEHYVAESIDCLRRAWKVVPGLSSVLIMPTKTWDKIHRDVITSVTYLNAAHV